MSNKSLDSEAIRKRVQGGAAAQTFMNAFTPETSSNQESTEQTHSGQPATQSSDKGSRRRTSPATRTKVTLDPKALEQSGYKKQEKYIETHTPRTYYIDNEVLDDMRDVAAALDVDFSRFVNDALRHYMKFLKGEL